MEKLNSRNSLTVCKVHQLLECQRKAARRKNGLKETPEDKATEAEGDIVGKEQENGVHSRLLTKKQLSEMAWGVREFSKKLGGLRLKLKVKTVFLLTKAHDEDLIERTRQLAEWLLSKERDTPYIVYVPGPPRTVDSANER